MRIAIMALSVLFRLPFFLIRMTILGKKKEYDKVKAYRYMQHCVRLVVNRGRVKVEAYGIDNIPKEDGFIFFPNHQGMFDVLSFFYTCPRPFSFVAKHEIKNIVLLKQVITCLHCICIDRSDLRQSMKVIQEMTERVKGGENFVIFPEGTRSRMGNKLNEMKAGSFKSAVKAQAPIVPCALIDAFKPFDENSIKKTTVKLIYLKPISYEEYKDMTTLEIASEVKGRIEKAIEEYA